MKAILVNKINMKIKVINNTLSCICFIVCLLSFNFDIIFYESYGLLMPTTWLDNNVWFGKFISKLILTSLLKKKIDHINLVGYEIFLLLFNQHHQQTFHKGSLANVTACLSLHVKSKTKHLRILEPVKDSFYVQLLIIFLIHYYNTVSIS